MQRSIICLGLVAGAAVMLPATLRAQTLKNAEVLSSIVLRPLAEPLPVLGVDGRVHLAYELLATNASGLVVTIDRVQAVDPDGAVLTSLDRNRLGKMTRSFSGGNKVLDPGGSAVIFMDVTLDPKSTLPKTIATRTDATRGQRDANGKLAPMPPDSPLPTHFSFTTAPFPVGQSPAVVIQPPLRGNDWVAVSGCCDAVTPHRGAGIAINGRLLAPERFAIDWVQLNTERKIASGDLTNLRSYAFYGASVYSVADGTVVNIYDSAPEQVPGRPPRAVKPENIGGNLVVVDIGGGRFAFYGHLQPKSITVKMGDRVRAGEIIGLLGNSGNSTGPHLHFHIMDGPSPLNANGLPYVFTGFLGVGNIGEGDEDALEAGKPVTINHSLAGNHRDQMPLNGEVVDFR